MNTKKLMNLALESVDSLGFQLDQMGITNRLNRHNLAAFLMTEQKRLEGEWDSLQAKADRRRVQLDQFSQLIESRAGALFGPVRNRLNRLRTSQ